jgi:tryptophan-rich sensory protein
MFEQPFVIALMASATVAVVVAVAGGVLTELSPWYHALKQPAWKPPDWAFGPVWTVILTAAAISAALAWVAAPTPGARAAVLFVLTLNSLLNIAWSGIFFKLKRPDWAFAEVLALWLSIAALIVVLGAQDWWAGFLMVPYLLWVSTAAFLNWRIVKLNGPFGQRHGSPSALR